MPFHKRAETNFSVVRTSFNKGAPAAAIDRRTRLREPHKVLGWAPCGFAAIPTAALDPPHSAASPAVPALIGSGSPSSRLLQFSDLLEFGQDIGVVLCKVPHDPGVFD